VSDAAGQDISPRTAPPARTLGRAHLAAVSTDPEPDKEPTIEPDSHAPSTPTTPTTPTNRAAQISSYLDLPTPTRDPSPHFEPDQILTATSVWMTGQQDAKAQRRGRYVPAAVAHPAKMLPAIARHAIRHYTRPGDIVLDPMCGIGTTLIEAVHSGRHALGVEYEAGWTALTRANLALARQQGVPGRGQVVCADARDLPRVAHPALAELLNHIDGTTHPREGRDLAHPDQPEDSAAVRARRWRRPVSFILTSPPYGEHTHGQVRAPGAGRPVSKSSFRYALTRRGSKNLAHAGPEDLLAGFTDLLSGALTLLRPGGHVVLTTRPYRRGGELIDLPSQVITAAQDSGLTLIERMPALLAGLRDDHLVPRASFFQLLAVRQARTAGIPQQITQHEDVLVFRLDPKSISSCELECARPGLGCPDQSSCRLDAQSGTSWTDSLSGDLGTGRRTRPAA
jgi:DNA methylase